MTWPHKVSYQTGMYCAHSAKSCVYHHGGLAELGIRMVAWDDQ